MRIRRYTMYTLVSLVILSTLLSLSAPVEAASSGSYGTKPASYPVPAGALIVSSAGEGTTCSEGQPCSLAHALKNAPKQAAIVLRAGLYRAGDFDINKNFTIQPFPGESVILDGSQVVADWSADGDDWTTNWAHTFPKSNGGGGFQLDEARANMDMVWIDGAFQSPVSAREQVAPGTFYVDYGAKKIFIGTNPAGKLVELTRRRYAIQRVTWDLGGVPGGSEEAGLTVRGLTFRRYAQDAIWTRAASAIIENNVFAENNHRALLTYRGDHIIRHNELRENRRSAIYIAGGERMLIENNWIYNNSFEGGQGSDNNVVLKLGVTNRAFIRANLVENNGGNGIWLDVGANNSTIVHNIVRSNTEAGIFYEISNNAIIAGNIAVGNRHGIRIFTSANGRIYNNTLVNNADAFDIVEYYRADADSNRGPGNAANTQVFNNIFFNTTSTEWPWVLVTVRTSLCGKHRLVKGMNHNAYHRSNPAQPKDVLRWDNVPGQGAQNKACEGQNQVTYPTLEAFRAAVHMEANGMETSGGDPFFVNGRQR